MQFDLIWLLFVLPFAFVLGWVASRFDFRQLRIQNRRSPRAYFRGLNHLLQNERDAAVDDFEQAVRNDPDTPELQFALGHLYRGRGEYMPAVRIHEHLLMRGDLNEAERARAQHALALDYTRAGILDRAERALALLESTVYETESRQIRLAIYERLRDWPQAAEVAERLRSSNPKVYTWRQTHYWCEQALGQPQPQALALLEQAHALAPMAPRPLIELARLQLRGGQAAAAIATFRLLQGQNPQWLALVLNDYLDAVFEDKKGDFEPLNLPEQLQKLYQEFGSFDFLEALVRLYGRERASAFYLQHLQRKASVAVATRWVALQAERGQEALPAEVVRALDKAEKPLLRYRCNACGFEGERHYWHCPGCQAWDSYSPNRVEDL